MVHSIEETKRIEEDLQYAATHPTHKWQHQVPKMPWHTSDKPFGWSQKDWDEWSEKFERDLGDYDYQVDDGYEAHLDTRSA